MNAPATPLDAPTQKTSLAPLLSVRRGVQAVEFYQRAFGAAVLMRMDAEDGAVVARLSVDGAEFWVADESPKHANFSPESLGGSSVRLVLTVADPDAVFARAVAAGATVVWPVADQSYGWRVGRMADPFGHHWEIGRPLARATEGSPSWEDSPWCQKFRHRSRAGRRPGRLRK